MRRMSVCAIAVLLAGTIATAPAVEWTRGTATEWVRLTDDGRSVGGALSPDGSSIAVIRLKKDFTADGYPFFHRNLLVGDGLTHMRIAQLPDSKPITSVDELRHTCAEASATWLASGDYIACRTDYADWTLIRARDGARTSVALDEEQAALVGEWELSDGDAEQLLRAMDENPWASDPLGKLIARPDCVPEMSDDWYYEDFRLSPTDADCALYTGADRHFDGCCCTAYLNHRYLGVVDLTTGRMRRLTWGCDHTVAHCRWTPEGRRVLYLRRPYASDSRWEFTGSDLHIISPTGTADRHLIAGVNGFSMLDDHRIMVFLRAHGWQGGETWWHDHEQQLAVLDLATMSVQRLTAGHFHHSYLDHRGDTFLVREMPVGQGVNEGDLYLIRLLQ